MTLYEKALEIATREHAGQTRKDGKPYISHPLAVEELTRLRSSAWAAKFGLPEYCLINLREVVSVIAILHDVLEDCDITFYQLREELLTYACHETVSIVMAALVLLTKKKGQSYFLFIQSIRCNAIATFVKLADIEHKLSDLEPGNLRDKYLFARHYLNSFTHEP